MKKMADTGSGLSAAWVTALTAVMGLVGVTPADRNDQREEIKLKLAQANDQREEIKLKLAFANFIVSLGIIASVIFAGLQWQENSKVAQENSKIATAAAYQRIVDLWHDHIKVFIEKPQLRPYFEESVKMDENSENAEAILAMADVRLDTMDAVLTFGELWSAQSTIEGWRNTFGNAFRTSPVLCQRLAKTKSNYGLIVPVGNAVCPNT
jgi:hypothetical protein